MHKLQIMPLDYLGCTEVGTVLFGLIEPEPVASATPVKLTAIRSESVRSAEALVRKVYFMVFVFILLIYVLSVTSLRHLCKPRKLKNLFFLWGNMSIGTVKWHGKLVVFTSFEALSRLLRPILTLRSNYRHAQRVR